MLAGRFSTGAIKAVGALALAAYAVSGRGRERVDYLADLALLLLATNLFNLLDLRPGPGREGVRRCCSPGSAWAPGRLAPLELLGIFIGPVLVGAAFTLRERAMLGDTGSNLVGALDHARSIFPFSRHRDGQRQRLAENQRRGRRARTSSAFPTKFT